ncbi:MAG: BPL-N domain-containing protein [Candidatus Thermoplasmatota archaeon]
MTRYLATLSFLILIIPNNILEEKEIKVAIYFSGVKRYAEEIKDAIEYSWSENGKKYKISSQIIGREDILNGKLSQYDVFVIPGSARPYLDAIDARWRNEVKKFVEEGGGYVGICGGANLASVGFDGADINNFLNPFLLRIANVYVNDEQYEEWQYLWRSNWRYGGIPLKVYINFSDNPIFSGFYGTERSIRYWGGPGMREANFKDEKFGEIVPLATFAEEPMEVAPLHYWLWKGEWIPYKNITTDIKGQYAAIATTYGKGKVVLFSPHPERETFFDGYVEEFPVRENLSPFTWFIYNWVSNNSSGISYNWWILRRAIAWAGNLEVPPASETAIFIEEPRYGIYFNGRKIIYSQNTVIIGYSNIFCHSVNTSENTIYLDDEIIYKGSGDIYLKFDFSAGFHKLKAIGKNEKEEVRNEVLILGG